MPSRGRILWVDDDGPGRFRYAEGVLKREGWEVEWAADAATAARRLGAEPFDVVLLDQETPVDRGDSKTRWAGCLVLYWLRGNRNSPPGLPRVDRDRPFASLPPLPVNQRIPVVAISDYDARELLDAMREASSQDRDIAVLSKPLDNARLKGLLAQVKG